MKSDVLRPFLEKTLADLLEVDGKIEPDEDGDYTYRAGSSAVHLRILDSDPAGIRLWSVLLKQVKPTSKVLRVLNGLNASLKFARVFAAEDAIILVVEVFAAGIDAEILATACTAISALADRLDTKLNAEVGGKKTFSEGEDGDDEVEV